MERVADRYRLVINPVIYAEVSIRFSRIEELDAVLPKTAFDREAIPYEAAFLAGKVFMRYRRHGGAKRSPLPDFFIGAHAAIAGHLLMTRDATRYRTYFPKLSLIHPDGEIP
ncbi:MAG: type II toxin-antitoxin system VapC family toxin [Hyphomicrobiales bacterium]|nr:type II toxin-antitoxin system VapC family toxin [Hyphomicrobiales bacterium]